MTTTEHEGRPYEGRLTTIDAVLRADQLVASFDTSQPSFGLEFLLADRDVLGALVAYAAIGVEEVALREDVDKASVRHAFRLRLTDVVALIKQEEERA